MAALSDFSNSVVSTAHHESNRAQRSLGLQLQVPIYSSGMIFIQVRDAHSKLMMFEQRRESLERQIVQNAREYHRVIRSDIEQIKVLNLTKFQGFGAYLSPNHNPDKDFLPAPNLLKTKRQLTLPPSIL